MKKILLILALVATLLTAACRKDYYDLKNPDYIVATNFVEQFEALWHGMDQCYVFWDRDTTDWDAMYERYHPLFEHFDELSTVTDDMLREAYTAIFGGLVDHHLSLQVRNFRTGHVIYVSPGNLEVNARDYYHGTWVDQQVAVVKNMEGVTHWTEWNGDCSSWFALLPAGGNDKIAYFRFRSFQFLNLRQAVQHGNVSSAALAPINAFYGSVADGMSTSAWPNSAYVKGIIVDVRGNGGGNLDEISPLTGGLMQNDLLLGYSRVKEGLGRLDYSVYTPYHVVCPSKHLLEPKPIVVLADCNSCSCAELYTLGIKSLPNGTFIGERTWGCTGPLMPGQNDVLYSGVFGDLNAFGYYVYTSNFDFVDANYQSLEGKGVEPDIWVYNDNEMLSYGQDPQLNAAINHIKSQIGK